MKLPRMMKPRVLRTSREIAVTGMARSGKTVFLTSLINHLLAHEPARFPIGDGKARISWHLEQKLPDKAKPFNYARYRDRLARGREWPEKTSDESNYVLKYRRSDWGMYHCRLRLFDFQGERFADAGIARSDSYAHWSDNLLNHLADNSDCGELAEEYRATLASDDVDRARMISGYKELMVKLLRHHKTLVTPSTFMIDESGKKLNLKDREDYMNARYSGLPPDKKGPREFVPMSAENRDKFPEITADFERAYKAYRRKIVKPLFDRIRNSDSLVILVDVISILAGGVGRYNNNCQILDEFSDVVSPASMKTHVSRWASFKPTKIKRIAFVVPKIDLVRRTPREKDKLKDLLEDMTSTFRDRTKIDCKCFACSAVDSTKPGSIEGKLVGRLDDKKKGEWREAEFEVSEVPEEWEPEWASDKYSFTYVKPLFALNHRTAPKQIGLSEVFDFVTGARPSGEE